MVPQIRIPSLIRTEDPTIQRFLRELRQAVLELTQVPFIQGVKVSNASLSTSVAKIEHKLGQAYSGAFALDGTGIILDTSNPNPEREIWVSLASGTSTSDLWVY